MQGDLGTAFFTAEETEFLTRTGPGTPMGMLFRRYWIPALLSQELPAPDCPPVRVRILGEDLVAFRDTGGRVGLIEPHCAHRGGHLFFGRNERDGIRCAYHGWQYDPRKFKTEKKISSNIRTRIRQKFEAELAKNGLTSLVPEDAYQSKDYQWLSK